MSYRKNNLKLIIGKLIKIIPFSGDYLNPTQLLSGRPKNVPNLFRNYGSKNIFLAILLRLSSTLKQIWRIVNRIGFPITEYIAMCWRLKCFINSYVIKSSGQIPDRRDCIAFFALLILPPLIENVSQNDVMYKTAVYYDVTVSQTSRVFSSHS